jgi:hypothetical protein
MPWVFGFLGLLVLYAVFFQKRAYTLSDLDPGIPPAVGSAVLVAKSTETNADMLASFAKVLAANGYPIAANLLAPGTAATPTQVPTLTKATTLVPNPALFTIQKP